MTDSDVGKIFGTPLMNLTVITVILTTREIIYRNRQIGSTLGLEEVGYKHFDQMIKD